MFVLLKLETELNQHSVTKRFVNILIFAPLIPHYLTISKNNTLLFFTSPQAKSYSQASHTLGLTFLLATTIFYCSNSCRSNLDLIQQDPVKLRSITNTNNQKPVTRLSGRCVHSNVSFATKGLLSCLETGRTAVIAAWLGLYETVLASDYR